MAPNQTCGGPLGIVLAFTAAVMERVPLLHPVTHGQDLMSVLKKILRIYPSYLPSCSQSQVRV